MQIADFTKGRDNNFNLIRIVASFGVLFVHSYILAMGNAGSEPVREILGMSFGGISVDVFFITSGFLVTASLLNRQSIVEFTCARVLRIFPALTVCIVLTVFVLGACFTTVPLAAYFRDHRTYHYLVKCSTLVYNVLFNLPGVFEHNPYRGAVNGSLWSMPYEIWMYLILGTLWGILRTISRHRVKVFQGVIITYAVLSGLCSITIYFCRPTLDPATQSFVHLSFMFFTGAAYYVLRNRITLSYRIFCPLALLLLLSVGNHPLFYLAYTATVAYLLFFLAYVPEGFIRRYNRLGDYSYGVYIYAFPVQQSVVALIPGISPLQLMGISAIVTMALSMMSWHFLEHRALSLKGRSVHQARRIFRVFQPEGSRVG